MNINIILVIRASHLVYACLQTLFYHKTIGLKNKHKGVQLIPIIFLYSAFLATANLDSVKAVADERFSIGLLIGFIMIVFYPIIICGGKIRERLLFGIISCILSQFSDILAFAVLSPDEWNLLNIGLIMQILICLTSVLFYFAFTMLIVHLKTYGKRYLPFRYWIGTITLFMIVTICMVAIYKPGSWLTDDPNMYFYVILFTVILVIVWLLIYFLFYFLCKYFSKVNDENTLNLQNEMMEHYILQKQASDEVVKRLSHDLKHSLVGWRLLAEEKGDTDALRHISEYEHELSLSRFINTENESANAIINQKHLEANQLNIEFQVDGAFHKDLTVNKIDLCSLIGNLLDNAIEAAAKAESQNLRYVKLSIRRKGNLLILVVENGYTVQPVVRDGIFLTNKRDKTNHGIGMMSLKHISEKYSGATNYSFENDHFKASVMMNGYSTVLSDTN